MSGVEFLPEHPSDAGDEEVLTTGSRRPAPRWLVPMAAALLVVAAVVVALSRGDTQPLAGSSSSQPQPQPTISAQLGPDDHVGGPLPAAAGQPVLDVEISPRGTWLLQARRVQALLGQHPPAVIPGPPLVDGDSVAVARLELDPALRRLWVVASGDRRARVLEYDADSMRLLLDRPDVPPVGGVAALGGHLYLTSANRLLDVAPDGQLRTAAHLDAQLTEVAADRLRGRLLMIDLAARTRVWAVVPRSGKPAHLSAPVRIAVTKASLAVADGWIWLAGFDTGAGVLMRLDPRTLRPDLHSALDLLLAPGASLVASGTSAVWVRDSGAGSELRCIEARTGRQLQSWNIDGPVTSTNAGALVATDEGVLPLRLDGCRG